MPVQQVSAPCSSTRPLASALRQDVPGIGATGEVVTVSPGHARNFLLPRRWAVPATEANRAAAAAQAQARAAAAAASRSSSNSVAKDAAAEAAEEAVEALERLTSQPVVMRVTVDKASGQPKHPVTAADLTRLLRERRFVELPQESLVLGESGVLSTVGEHIVPLRLDTRVLKGKHAITVSLKKKL